MDKINLDAAAIGDVEVVLGGETYIIPADLDMDETIKLMELSEKAQAGDVKASIEVLKFVKGLFAIKNSEDKVKGLRLSIQQASELLAALMNTKNA